MSPRIRLLPLILASIFALAIDVPAADAAPAGKTREKSLVRIVNPTAYWVKYTVVDAYGPETAWIKPNSHKDWTAAHDGTIRTHGKAWKDGKAVLVWDSTKWDVKATPKFRITLTK